MNLSEEIRDKESYKKINILEGLGGLGGLG